MFTIIKHQLQEGLQDAKFLFLALLILITFTINGVVYSEQYNANLDDYAKIINTTTQMLDNNKDNLQSLANYTQTFVKPPSALTFIADGGNALLPNAMTVNAFIHRAPHNLGRGNKAKSLLPPIDWVFIVGTLMSLLCLLISFGVICGEKRDGTLKLLFSYPVSRITIFFGKYLGILAVLLLTFFLGITINLAILSLNGALPLTAEISSSMILAILLSILSISFVLLLGMSLSSLSARPAVSLVSSIIVWIIMVIAIPGLARLIAEQNVDITSSYDIAQEKTDGRASVRDSLPDDAGNWNGDPFRENVPRRAKLCQGYLEADHKADARSYKEKLDQANMIHNLSMASPAGLLSSSFQNLANTGSYGFKSLIDTARRYKTQMHDFTEAIDKKDPDTPHLLYSWGASSDPGVFSQKPVELSSVPRSQALWLTGGLPLERELPMTQLYILLAANFAIAILAFLGLMKYDPR
jgi:ABC-type transport system involved in multi-copper enzyme maturation permease subunit